MKRIYISAILLLSLLFSAMLPIQSASLEPAHKASDEYLASQYGANLASLQLTGDERTDVILVALSQLGYHEGDSDAEMGGANAEGSRDFVEFNRLHGKLDNLQGNGVSYGYYWCCAFATWCARQAGVEKSVVPGEVSCQRLIEDNFEKMGVYRKQNSGYLPRSGDYIFFLSAGNSPLRVSNHVGIVLYVYNGRVYTIEGNSKTDDVAVMNYALDDSYIVGYASPKYKENAEAAIEFNPYSAGFTENAKYYITAAEVAVHKEPDAESSTLGKLYRKDVVTVFQVDGFWGKVSTGDESGWIKLENAQYAPTLKNAIIYDSLGGSLIPATPFDVGDEVTVSTVLPKKQNEAILGWALTKEDALAKRIAFYAGEAVSLDKTTTLYAIWETAPTYTVTLKSGTAFLSTINVVADGRELTLPAVPHKSSEKPFEYIWVSSGWDENGDGVADYASGANIAPKNDMVLEAVYESKPITYTVTFLGYDDKVIKTDYLSYGDIPTPPTRVDSYFTDDGKYEHRFDGWLQEITAVTGNAVYTAKFIQVEVPIVTNKVTDAPQDTSPTQTTALGTTPVDATNQNIVNQEITKIVIISLVTLITVGALIFIIVWKRTAKKG